MQAGLCNTNTQTWSTDNDQEHASLTHLKVLLNQSISKSSDQFNDQVQFPAILLR